MYSIYTGLAVWNLLILGAFSVLAVLQMSGAGLGSDAFQLAGAVAAVFCCVVQTLVIAHFVGSMKWIQQSGPTAGMDDTKPLRTAWIKGRMFPLLILAMLAAVWMGIFSGAAETGAMGHWVPTALAVLTWLLSARALPLARAELIRQKQRMREVQGLMDRRITAGAVRDEPEEALIPESTRAAAKVLVFLAVNVWVLYAYFRFVLRRHEHPILPYAIGCAVLLVLGLGMRAFGAPAAQPPGTNLSDPRRPSGAS